MRRKSSFVKALADAEKRLAKAKEERVCSLDKVSQLSQEIPALEQTIVALRTQLGGAPQIIVTDIIVENVDAAGRRTVVPSSIPEEIAKHLVLDLSDMGSIPAQPEEKSADSAPDTK